MVTRFRNRIREDTKRSEAIYQSKPVSPGIIPSQATDPSSSGGKKFPNSVLDDSH
jgi:hypothetical protein